MSAGECARRLRERREMTIGELAERAGVPREILSRFENGKTDPRLSTLIRLTDVLGVSIAEYTGITPEDSAFLRRKGKRP